MRNNQFNAQWSALIVFVITIALVCLVTYIYAKSNEIKKVYASDGLVEAKDYQLKNTVSYYEDKVKKLEAENFRLLSLRANATDRSLKNISYFEQNIMPLTKQCGIPNALAAAQWALESGRAGQRSDNNHFGIGPGWKFNSVEDEVKVYCKTIKNILAFKGYDLSKISDPIEIVTKLQEGNKRYEGHSDRPYEYVKLITGLAEFERYYR